MLGRKSGIILYTQCELTPQTHQTQGRAADSLMQTQQPNTTSTQLPTLCCPNPLGGRGRDFFFPVLLLQILINKLSSESTDLVPDMKGVWWVKGHYRQPRGRCTRGGRTGSKGHQSIGRVINIPMKNFSE